MIRALIFLHRWLGIAFGLLFALWFASGIVMHFVPYPSLTAADRRAGLAPIDLAQVETSPWEALAASRIENTARVRLVQRSDGPIYLVSNLSRTLALHAADLSEAAVVSAKLARAIALDYAMRRQWHAPAASIAALLDYDQWTLPAELDPYRPLYRVALNDASETDLYVSKTTGEVVLATTHRQRAWNYTGSVAHWIYLTALRMHPIVWSRLLWWLSFVALIGATLGACVGILRIEVRGSRLMSPYAGLHAWHHWLGLGCSLFVLTWLLSGWLSMDDGTLFSPDKPSDEAIAAAAGAPDWSVIPHDEASISTRERSRLNGSPFGGDIYRRQIHRHDQWLDIADVASQASTGERALLDGEEINATARRLAPSCAPAVAIGNDEAYAPAAILPETQVFRLICGDDWFDIDAANGALLDKLDRSRRAYGWLADGLHRLDFPVLARQSPLPLTMSLSLPSPVCYCRPSTKSRSSFPR